MVKTQSLIPYRAQTANPRPLSACVSKFRDPRFRCFLPSRVKASGVSLVIFPGGGYVGVAIPQEGTPVAEALQDIGITAILVKYRLPSPDTMQDPSVGPLEDAQQAIRFVREHATDWKLDPSRVGVMGFSAGGHLASTAGTHFDKSYIDNPDRMNLRPDFMILVYPLISMDAKLTHSGSISALLGKTPTAEKVRLFSNELQATAKTPPTLLLQAADDHTVDVDNSISFFEALRKTGVPVDMTIFDKGDHGFVLLPRSRWLALVQDWMERHGWLVSH